MAKKKKVSDLAQEAFESASLFNDEGLSTAEKNSEGDALPEEFFAEEAKAESEEAEENNEEMSEESSDVEVDAAIFLQEEEETPGFLPEVSEEDAEELLAEEALVEGSEVSLEGTELDGFESAQIEEVEFVEEERLESIIESILFASDRPVSLASLKLVFKGTNINTQKIRRVLDSLAVEYAGGRRGVTLEEVPGGYQLRTKIDNMEFMRRTLKARPFKLSGPALEVLAIVAYKQPLVKSEVDVIRGVESGHLLRALMEKNLVCFEGKSELPGRPMQYGTTRKFLEIFGLRNLKELPTLSQIDELLPEGIGEDEEVQKPTLATITDSMSELVGNSYSQGEEELTKITEQLEEIATSSDFFEKEKIRQREKRDQEKAQNIREALALGESVPTRDVNWLKRYDEALAAGQSAPVVSEEGAVAQEASAEAAGSEENPELQKAIAEFDAETEEEASEEFSEDDELPFLGEADDIGEDEAPM
ncbi:SMC-Scp complex subunit ScpB [Bdellovibrio sp. HCB337]|uniref:SMC-Scp complex subunit ScpB n=1 Tax=Bdellovibrio sp. HCB337 TaxID=3394358 RepID=UPI0039A429F7